MSGHKDIETIHKISEVLAEAFAKVKYITEDYLKSNPKESKEKPQAKKDKNGSPSEHKQKPNTNKEEKSHKKNEPSAKVNSSQSDKSHDKSQDKSKESKKEQKEEKKHKEEKKEAHPDRPKKPLTPFFRFNQQNIEKVKAEYPNLSHTETVSVIAQIWGQLSQEERLPYESKYNEDMEVYNQELDYFFTRHPEQRPKKGKNSKKP